MNWRTSLILLLAIKSGIPWIGKDSRIWISLINHRSTAITWWQGVSSPPENSKINRFDYQSSINHSGNFLRFKNIFKVNSNRFAKSKIFLVGICWQFPIICLYNFLAKLKIISLSIYHNKLMNLFQRRRQFFQWSSPPVKELTDAKPYNLWTTLRNAKKEARCKKTIQ